MNEYYYFLSMVCLCFFYSLFYKKYKIIYELQHTNNNEPFYVVKKHNI